MLKPSVTICLVPSFKSGPWVFWDQLEVSIPKTKTLGFKGVELFAASAESIDCRKLARLLDENEIELAAIGTGAGKVLHNLTLTNPDKEIRLKAVEYIKAMIDRGALFNAPIIIGSMQGSIAENSERGQCFEWLIEGLRDLCKYAEDRKIMLLFEPLNRYETNIVNNLQDGVELIRNLTANNIKLLADLFHMNIEDANIPESIRAAGKHIGYVHFADSNRRSAGMGHIDLPQVIEALISVGYDGYLSAEVLPYPTPDMAAVQTIKMFNFLCPQ
jgi:sugar phosphate isomerase/epimerase